MGYTRNALADFLITLLYLGAYREKRRCRSQGASVKDSFSNIDKANPEAPFDRQVEPHHE